MDSPKCTDSRATFCNDVIASKTDQIVVQTVAIVVLTRAHSQVMGEMKALATTVGLF